MRRAGTTVEEGVKAMPRLIVILSTAVLLVVVQPTLAQAEGGSGYAGSEACRDCHGELFAHFERNVHAGASVITRSGVTGCEACHGPAAAHAQNPENTSGLITFAAGGEGAGVAACLSCHREDRKVSPFPRATHGRSGLVCTSCHSSPHAPAPVQLVRARFASREGAPVLGRHLKDNRDELCLSCHTELRGALAMPFHHPVAEGALACTSCHNPHAGGATLAAGREVCLSCHEDKRGPWAFEHAPVAEGCQSCHDPHGSVAPALLRTAEPFLCLSCHVLPDDRHGEEIGGTRFSRAIYQRCTTCHGAVHGSHGDRHLKK